MPRKPRIEYPGAVYHVISRGNYRKELFLHQGTGEAFERCLLEAVDRCGWKLHAYVIMSNHYHLAVETPESNLVVGMFRGEADKTGRVVNRNSGCKALLPRDSTDSVMSAAMFSRDAIKRFWSGRIVLSWAWSTTFT